SPPRATGRPPATIRPARSPAARMASTGTAPIIRAPAAATAASSRGPTSPGSERLRSGGALRGAASPPDVVQDHREACPRLRELLVAHGDRRRGIGLVQLLVVRAPVLRDVVLVAAGHVTGLDGQRHGKLAVHHVVGDPVALLRPRLGRAVLPRGDSIRE